MFECEVFVGEGFGAVDAGAAGAIAVEEVAALDHEVGDLEEGLVGKFSVPLYLLVSPRGE